MHSLFLLPIRWKWIKHLAKHNRKPLLVRKFWFILTKRPCVLLGQAKTPSVSGTKASIRKSYSQMANCSLVCDLLLPW